MNKYKEFISKAIDYAKSHLGSKDFTYICLGFVEDCYEKSNDVEIFGGDTAKESSDLYEAEKNKGIPPPTGSFVFYNCTGVINCVCKNWGHVGICIGNEIVIHAWDAVRENNYLDVQNLTPAPGWSNPEYIGWTPVERIFRGYRDNKGTN